MRIVIQTISHENQRYKGTVGDWVFTPGELQIFVSETGNDDSNFAIALHEAIEAWACKKAGVTGEEVDEFDKHSAIVYPGAEPGDLEDSPYFQQHQFATKIERMVIAFLAWSEHEKVVDKVYEGK